MSNRLEDFDFAGDIYLLMQLESHIHELLRFPAHYGAQAGFKINGSKLKLMQLDYQIITTTITIDAPAPTFRKGYVQN